MLGAARGRRHMSRGDYHLLTRWEIEAQPREVYDLVADLVSLPSWWPSTFLDARPLAEGQEGGVGREVGVLTAGFLPVTLRWRVRIAAARPGERITVETSGDLEGLGVWAFEPGDRRSVVRFNWRGRLARPGLRPFPTFLRPLFMASYRWAMERGFTSLLLEVWRRRATDPAAREWLPRPPGPVFPHTVRRWWLVRRAARAAAVATPLAVAPAEPAEAIWPAVPVDPVPRERQGPRSTGVPPPHVGEDRWGGR